MTTTRPVQTEVARDRGSIEDVPSSILYDVHLWLARHSITALRVSMGAIIFGYGFLKYFPGVSPAENLVQTTTHLLTFGLVPDWAALALVATLECTIGLSLITGRGLRLTIYLLIFWVLGILSPIVLLPQQLFSGPNHAPTLEGQYVLKDIVFLTASLVIATTLRHRNNGHPACVSADRRSEQRSHLPVVHSSRHRLKSRTTRTNIHR